MNHKEPVARIATETTTEAAVIDAGLSALASQVQEVLTQGGRVQLKGVMIAEVAVRTARTGRNPRTGEPIEIPEHRGVRLTPSAAPKRAASEED